MKKINKDKKEKKSNLKEIKTLYKYVKQDKFKMLLSFVCMLISALCSITTGYLQGQTVESIIALNIKNAVLFMSIYFLMTAVFENSFRGIGVYIARKLEAKLSMKLATETYKKMLCMPAYAFEEKSSGELINRITNDSEGLSNSFDAVIEMIIDTFCCMLIFIYIIFNSYIVAIEIIVFLFIVFIITKKMNPKMKQIYDELKKEKDVFAAVSTESIRGVREIKTLGIIGNLKKEVDEIREIVFNKELRDRKIHRLYAFLMWLIRGLFECTVFITCLIQIYHGTATVGFFMAMTWYVYRYTWLIQNLAEVNIMYQKMAVSVRRINEIIDNRLYQDDKFGNIRLRKAHGNITFDKVSFAYPNEDNILNDFSVSFETGKKIAVVGKSGQGKSTLFNLITRIFDNNAGNIYLDNINIKDLTEDTLRKTISVIRQEPFVFNRSIKDNFKIVKPNITLNEIRKYCKMAYLDDYIMTLPKKYNTLLGEGGVNLSGGQKQRLSIARALAKESKIILFDEATSALDNESQSYIKNVIDDLVKDHAVIIIAHRLSTIVDSDVIYVVDKGKISDYGTHKELLKKSNVYKTLYENEDEM